MSKTCFLVSIIVVGLAGAARAGGQAGSIGVGAEYQMNGLGGLSVVYDGGIFHVGGMLGYNDPPADNDTVFQLAGEFYYHVHHSAFADFGLGGSLGFNSVPVAVMGRTQRNTEVYFEPGFQIRAFLSSNVALSATAGLVIGRVDADRFAITGSNFGAAGGVGIHYYFY
jgi:hypothetical protein